MPYIYIVPTPSPPPPPSLPQFQVISPVNYRGSFTVEQYAKWTGWSVATAAAVLDQAVADGKAALV